MKNLLLSILLIVIVSFTQAQEGKPTKEETVKFLNNQLQVSIGPDKNGDVITFIELKYDSYIIEFQSNLGQRIKLVYSSLPWDQVKEIANEIDYDNYSSLTINFNRNIQYTVEGLTPLPEIKNDIEININVPKDKIESCKKAILRLAEIAKEENQDPFAN